jgi:hypothetical protein
MASLLSGTTIGGHVAVHANNISTYALTSVPSNVITTSGGQTIAGITYFSNGESLNLYGIRGRFTNEYIHLYHKVGIGHPGGWGQGEGSTPGYGLSTYGGATIAYGNSAGMTVYGSMTTDSYVYTNYNVRVGEIWGYGGLYRSSGDMLFGTENGGWRFHYGNSQKVYIGSDGNIWMAWAGDYLSNLLGAKQNASTAITTSNIGSQSVNYASSAGNADTVDGRHADYFYPSNTDNGYSTGDINGNTTHQRLWGTDSVQNLIQFNAPTTVEYSTDGTNWTATTIPNDVFSGKVYGAWGGMAMNVGNNRGGWRYVRMTWVNFGYRFFSHFTIAHSTNGHSFNFVFQKSDLNGNNFTEAFRQNSIGSWPGYTFAKHSNVSGWWDTRDIRLVFELNNNPDYPDNAIQVGHIGIMGSYGSFTRLYDWDYDRNVTFANQINAAGGNSSQWNTAYGWGNHASAGYQAASTAINTSNIGSQSVSYASNAGSLDSLDSTDFMRNYGIPAGSDQYVNFRVIRNDNAGSGSGMHIGYGNRDGGDTLIYGGGSTSASLYVYGGYAYAPGSFRAPIFYDSNDTAYYVDPNSTSNLAASYIGRVLINYDGTDTWFRMQSGNRMRITTTGGTDFIIPNTGEMTYNGNTVIHAGNIGSQSVSYADESGYSASSGSVEWGNVNSRPTALSQFTNDLGNYGGWLTTSGKAADSELFDGTDSIYFVKGNGVNTLGRTTTNNSGGNSAGGLSSGFYDGSGMSNMPTSDWYHLIVNSHYNSSTSNQYEFHIATPFWDKSNFYVRSISPGDVGPWRTLIHNGNIGSQSVSYASSAGNADTVDNYHASSLWRSDGGNWNPGANITLYQTGNSQEWSFDIYRQGYTGGYWHVWDSVHSTMLGVDATNNYVWATGSFRAPIFYDSNDTTYYGDFAGTSYLRHLSVGDVNASNDGGWNARLNLTGSSHARLDVKSNSDGIITTIYSHIGQGVGRVGTSSNHPLAFMVNGGIAGYAYANYLQGVDSVRAPIFYDSNDTNYYVDPNSISVLAGFNLNSAGTAKFRYLAPGEGTVNINAPFTHGTSYGAINIAMTDNDTGGVVIDNEGVTVYGAGDTGTVFRVIDEDVWQTNGNNVDAATTFRVNQGADAGTLTRGTGQATNDFRAPIFYDSDDTGYYLDPNGTSNLLQLTTATRARWGKARWWNDRSSFISDQGYWTGTNGWTTSQGTWANAWKGGFSGWDIWGTSTDHPQGAGSIHAQGIVSGQHYASSDGGEAYGWMMVGAHAATENRYWLRGKWGTATSGWVEMITTGNIGSQSVSYADESGYSASTGTTDNIGGIQFRNTGSNAGTNADTIDSNGITYYTAGVSNFSGNATDGALYSQRYSTVWQHQIAGDYRSGQIAVRGRNAGTWTSWRTILDNTNASYAAAMNQNVRTDSDPTFNSTYFANSNLRLYQGSGTALHIQTAYGYGVLGPQNGSWFHFETDRANFYFGRSVYVNGSVFIYGGSQLVENNGGTWGISISGNAASASSVDWYNVSNKPASWLNTGTLVQDMEPSAQAFPSGFYQSYLGSGNPTGTWFNYINVRHSNSGNGHGYQLGMSYYDNNLWFRSYQGGLNPTFQSWSRALGTNTDPYPSNMNQYVRTSDDVTFNTTTAPTILVNNHSDNTKGYRIHNTSGTSVSAMFTNSANALVIGAGAFDQVQLNKKVYVNGVALGVNVAPSATAGRIDASNDIVAYSSSDERLKQNITPIENALDKVKSLTGVEFDWKPEYKHAHGYEGHDTGIIAQQVQEVIPSAVRTNDTGFLAVRYEKLIGLLIEANKELAARVEELEKKLG